MLSKFSVQISLGFDVLNCDMSPKRKPEVDLRRCGLMCHSTMGLTRSYKTVVVYKHLYGITTDIMVHGQRWHGSVSSECYLLYTVV